MSRHGNNYHDRNYGLRFGSRTGRSPKRSATYHALADVDYEVAERLKALDDADERRKKDDEIRRRLFEET